MSAPATSVPTSQTESKTSRRKKGKAEAANNTTEEAVRSPTAETGPGATGIDTPTNGLEASYESPYIKELYK